MNIENIQAQMRKGILEYCILAIIGKGEIYASDIIEQLKEAELIVVEGTLYPLLNRLKNAGFLTYNWKESVMGPPRKYYSVTEKGQSFLNEMNSTWNKLSTTVEKLTNQSKNS